MFLDSDVNARSFGSFNEDVSSFGDENFLNHPGLFSISDKKDKKLYDEYFKNLKKTFPISSDIDCDTIDDSINKIDKALSRKANSGEKARVVKRHTRALENRRLDFKNAWDEKNCTEQKLDIQAEEFDTNIQTMFSEANRKSEMRKTEDKTLTNVSIGVGALVIGVVTYMAIR